MCATRSTAEEITTKKEDHPERLKLPALQSPRTREMGVIPKECGSFPYNHGKRKAHPKKESLPPTLGRKGKPFERTGVQAPKTPSLTPGEGPVASWWKRKIPAVDMLKGGPTLEVLAGAAGPIPRSATH